MTVVTEFCFNMLTGQNHECQIWFIFSNAKFSYNFCETKMRKAYTASKQSLKS